MGQGQRKGDDPLKGIQGLQVVRVLPHSPAHVAGLLPFFDIITAVDQMGLLDAENVSEQFRTLVAERENHEMCLRVYNLRIHAYRDVFCVPNCAWGGGGMLGCSVEWTRAETCKNRTWHVIEVVPGSPVDRCGEIKAERDHIIGMQRAEEQVITLLRDEDEFYTRMEFWRSLQRAALQRLQCKSMAVSHGVKSRGNESGDIGKLLFLIYDSVANEVREVVVDMGTDVDAPLGMNLAAGLLHSLLTPFTLNDEAGGGDGSGGSSNTGRLPVITFASHLGTCAPPQSMRAVSVLPDASEEKPYSPPSPPPMSSASPIQPVVHCLSLPIEASITMKYEQRSPPSQPHITEAESPAAVRAAASQGSEVSPALLQFQGSLADRPAIPAIARSLPTSVAKHVEQTPQSIAAAASTPLQAGQPQSKEATRGNVQTSGPFAQLAGSGMPLERNSATQQQQQPPPPPPGFPKLPPPLYFPILRPTTPSR